MSIPASPLEVLHPNDPSIDHAAEKAASLAAPARTHAGDIATYEATFGRPAVGQSALAANHKG